MADDLSAVEKVLPVSRETAERLSAYVGLLRKWQPAENLISPKTLPEIWRRHIADAAQLVRLYPSDRRWIDLGSGAGLPGLVIAICLASGSMVHMVESNRRKCAFLRAAIRETGAPADVYEGRVEDVLDQWTEPVDRVTARALAPLAQLLKLAKPVMAKGVPAAFMKGQGWEAEVEVGRRDWNFDLATHDSLTGEGGVILDIRSLRAAGESE
ncbi:MAG TPA: 16S rRNA (guanine(527)-N(7))-methyltransferase RsmG [Bauldia sp.]|nr:16S rRNA (guanine(527)-N(7))-methyltransferase RsmG [Bauldia sp.]